MAASSAIQSVGDLLQTHPQMGMLGDLRNVCMAHDSAVYPHWSNLLAMDEFVGASSGVYHWLRMLTLLDY